MWCSAFSNEPVVEGQFTIQQQTTTMHFVVTEIGTLRMAEVDVVEGFNHVNDEGEVVESRRIALHANFPSY
jgi:hypothetical protein